MNSINKDYINIKIIVLIFLIVSLLQAQSLKDIKFKNVTVDKITSIYDGDTFRVNINSYPPIIGHRMAIRVNGIDAPELRTKCSKEKNLAIKAKQLTVSILRGAKVIELKNIKRGKYFRIIADVYADGKSVGNALLKRGLAVSYDGGTKTKDWCK